MALSHMVRDALLRPAARLTRLRVDEPGESVLILQPDHLGDIMLAQPAVRVIREQFPASKLIAVVGPWSAQIARIAWPVDEILTLPFPGFERAETSGNPFAPYKALADHAPLLRSFHPGAAFVLRPDAWWAAWLASAATPGPIVAASGPRMDAFVTHPVDVAELPHTTRKAIAIASGLSPERASEPIDVANAPLKLAYDPDAIEQTQRLLEEHEIGGRYVIVHPGSGADVKLWPLHRWRTLCARLNANGFPVLVTGADSECDLADHIAEGQSQTLSLAGKTPLPVLIELLRNATAVIGTDNGPLHLAVACESPTLHLFGPSDPLRYGPWGPALRHRVVTASWTCSQCGDLSDARRESCGCMLAIDVPTVVQAFKDLLANNHDQ